MYRQLVAPCGGGGLSSFPTFRCFCGHVPEDAVRVSVTDRSDQVPRLPERNNTKDS